MLVRNRTRTNQGSLNEVLALLSGTLQAPRGSGWCYRRAWWTVLCPAEVRSLLEVTGSLGVCVKQVELSLRGTRFQSLPSALFFC